MIKKAGIYIVSIILTFMLFACDMELINPFHEMTYKEPTPESTPEPTAKLTSESTPEPTTEPTPEPTPVYTWTEPVVHLPLDTDVMDYSGNNNHGTLYNNPQFITGQIDQSLEFTANNQYITLDAAGDLLFGDSIDFSVTLWIKHGAQNNDSPIIGNKNWSSGANTGWIIAMNDDSWQWNYKGATGNRKDITMGNNPDQIPLGAEIISALLLVDIADSGGGLKFHQMLIDWNDTDTWDSLIDGVSNNDDDAVFLTDIYTGAIRDTGLYYIDVTVGIQSWSDGQTNYGWVIKCINQNNVDIYTSDEFVNQKPKLIINYIPPS